MYNEFTFTAIVLLLVCAALTIVDLLCSGLVSLFSGIKFGRAFCWGLLSFLLPAGALAYGLLVERNIFKTNEVELHFDSLPESFDGYRIVHISDIHSRSFRNRTGALERAVAKINALHPDLVAFTGDLITIRPEELDRTAPSLKAVTATDGVVSILGNHDYCTHISGSIGSPDAQGLAELERRERELGWCLLLNENISLRRGADSLSIVGVENWSRASHFPSTGDLAKASEGTEGTFRILLTHDPTHWESEASGKDFPLTLSGHTHAAQTSLFGWCPSKYVFKHYRGLYEENGRYLYVNIGLGETAYPVRIGTVPEITLITLRRK
ncbi:MAG: metallophosphoesterase [Bacteroidales bacterium]|nr:metallophosphoesterase [Bacteroidales bacterium]